MENTTVSAMIHCHGISRFRVKSERLPNGYEYWTIKDDNTPNIWTLFIEIDNLELLKAEIDSALAERELFKGGTTMIDHSDIPRARVASSRKISYQVIEYAHSDLDVLDVALSNLTREIKKRYPHADILTVEMTLTAELRGDEALQAQSNTHAELVTRTEQQ